MRFKHSSGAKMKTTTIFIMQNISVYYCICTKRFTNWLSEKSGRRNNEMI